MADTSKRNRTRDGRFGSGIRVRGFYRVHIVEHDEVDGAPRVVGDSGWIENKITTIGKAQYLALALAGNAASKFVGKMALGTGTEPASNSTSLDGEFADMTNATQSSRNRMSVVTSTGLTGEIVTVQFAATWSSVAPGFVTAAHTIRNIGLHWSENASSNVLPGSLFSGTTFGTSQLNTNQDVNKINDLESLAWAA